MSTITTTAVASPSLALLREMFPARLALSFAEAAPLINTTAGAMRNRHAAGRLPIRVKRLGRRVLIPVVALAEYLDQQGNAPPPRPAPTSPDRARVRRGPGPGRPRKAADMRPAKAEE